MPKVKREKARGFFRPLTSRATASGLHISKVIIKLKFLLGEWNIIEIFHSPLAFSVLDLCLTPVRRRSRERKISLTSQRSVSPFYDKPCYRKRASYQQSNHKIKVSFGRVEYHRDIPLAACVSTTSRRSVLILQTLSAIRRGFRRSLLKVLIINYWSSAKYLIVRTIWLV